MDQPTNGPILLFQYVPIMMSISQTSLLYVVEAKNCRMVVPRWCRSEERCLRRQSPQESQKSPRNLPLMFCRWSRVSWTKCHCILAQLHPYLRDIAKCCTNSSEFKLVPNKNRSSSTSLYSIPSIIYTLLTTKSQAPWNRPRPDHKNSHRGGPLALLPQRSHSLVKVAPVIDGCVWLSTGWICTVSASGISRWNNAI